MRKTNLSRCKSLLVDQLHELQRQASVAVVEMASDEESALQPDPTDRATVESDRSFDLRLKDRDRKLVLKVREALGRIDEGSYGVCEECGGPISEGRLLARPVTTRCIECKEESERRERRE